ncbi:MAG TPA: DUF1761 domain-containing protein [Candidatus Paceibacterota bacterium]|nr:DUF1761 domain-containing protein [Candidatus Paceibacterota bacterium]
MIPVNFWAVLVSAVAAMFIGWLWFGPLFRSQWVASLGMSDARMQEMMRKGMAMSYVVMFIGALLMAFVLAHAIIFAEAYLGMTGVSAGLAVAFASWIGFVAPATVGGVLWEGKSWNWWFITAGYHLVLLLVMGVILALWV